MKNNGAPLPPPESWQAVNYQFVTFWEDPHSPIGQEWWRDITGGADCTTTRQGMKRTDAGEFQGHQLQLVVTPIRADWMVLPKPFDPTNIALDAPPTIGTLREATDWLISVLTPWIEHTCPPVVRLSSVMRLIQLTPSRDDNYRLLDRYLPDVRVDPSASEFQYRINRKRPSRTDIPSLTINRLCTWSSAMLSLQLAVENLSNPTQRVAHKQEFHAALLEADINTDPEFAGALPTDRRLDVWRELVDLTAEITAKGDVH